MRPVSRGFARLSSDCPHATTSHAESATPMKPRLRGVLHTYAFYVSLCSGLILVFASSTDWARLTAAVYTTALASLFGVSALYHRITWAPRARSRMRRLDHSMIFILIAGTYTAMGLMALPRPLGPALLTTVWAASLAGIGFNLVWVTAPRWLAPILYLILGWIAVAALPELVGRMSAPTLLLLALGGAVYSVGALVYATKRPNPAPAVFGYHEVFHALTIVAAGMHFAAVASVVLPTA